MEGLIDLLQAGSLAARGALFGSAVFLLAVTTPMARRLTHEQALELTAATQFILRISALATLGSAALALGLERVPLVGGLATMLASLGILTLAPRRGPASVQAYAVLLLALFVLLVAVTGGDPARLTLTGLTTAFALREAGAAIWLGGLPALWLALRSPWPPAVSQAVAARHLALMLPGLALIAGGTALAWQIRALFTTEETFPLLAFTLAVLVLALLAAGLRTALIAQGSRPGAGSAWLPRMRCVTEAEGILALVLCGSVAALLSVVMSGTVSAVSFQGSLLPRLSLHAPGTTGIAGLLLLAMAALAGWHRAGGPPITRFGPLLLLPLGALLVWRADTLIGLVLAWLVLVAAVAEARALWSGVRTYSVPVVGALALLVFLAGHPPAGAMLPALIALLAIIARWTELRLRTASPAWPLSLGALGLLMILVHGG
ncbi:MAG: hypothetical protein JWR10_1995 [Rubritepida sp.]|nr:hypothetical protein [Rubritepida sp.]